jgi:Ca2+-binding EF-hand superfamily protein
MSKLILGGAMAAAMVVIAPAIAQAPKAAPAPHAGHHIDQPGLGGPKHGGLQTRATLGQHVQTLFAKLDTNRDGSITKAEADAAKAVRHERIEKRIERRADGDGGDRRAMFDRIDSNRDGTISRSEFDAAPRREERRIVIRDGKGPDAGGHGMHGMHKMRGAGMGGLHGAMFEMADSNRDGRVTLQEATTAAYRHFDSADANRDGQISPDERRQMRQRMRSERRPG